MRSFILIFIDVYEYVMTKKVRHSLPEVAEDSVDNEHSEESSEGEQIEEIVMSTTNKKRKNKLTEEDENEEEEEEEEEDDEEDEESDDDDIEGGEYEGMGAQDMFDETDVDIQEVLSQFFQNSEGENIPDLLNDLRVAVDNNSKCILKVAKELKTMNALYARKNS